MGSEYKNRSFIKRLMFAISGIKEAWEEEKSFRTHIFLALLTIITALIARVSFYDMALIIVCVFSVLAAELLNTTVEHMVDLMQPEIDPRVKKIKDMAAGMVLIVSVGAMGVGVVILLRNLFLRFN